MAIFYYRNLYLGDGVENPLFIMDMLENGVSFLGIYVLSVGNHGNLMEILSSAELFKPVHQKKTRYIIGLASGKKEAFSLAKKIVADYYLKMNSFTGFHDYFLRRCV